MSHEPIFKAVFGKQWEHLPPVMHKHYANRPYSNDAVSIEGRMDITLSWFARLLSPLMRIAGALVPFAGQNISVQVHFRSEEHTNHFIFDRIFNFPGKKPYRFRSCLIPVNNVEVIELMPIGIGWNARYRFDGRKILLEHRGYSIKLGSKWVRLPLEWLLGTGYAEEEALSDDRFRMSMVIEHPLIGKIYEYKGTFAITLTE